MNPEIFKKLLTEVLSKALNMERMYAPTGVYLSMATIRLTS